MWCEEDNKEINERNGAAATAQRSYISHRDIRFCSEKNAVRSQKTNRERKGKSCRYPPPVISHSFVYKQFERMRAVSVGPIHPETKCSPGACLSRRTCQKQEKNQGEEKGVYGFYHRSFN